MRVTILNPQRSKRDDRLVTALTQGFNVHGDEVKVSHVGEINEELIDWTQMVCFIGHIGNWPAYREFNRAGKDILLVDDAYLHARRYWRFALNGWQSRWMFDSYYKPERLYDILNQADLLLEPYEASANRRAVTYMGITNAFGAWHKLGAGISYDSGAARTIGGKLPPHMYKLFIKVPYDYTVGLWVGQRAELVTKKVAIEQCLAQSAVLASYAQPANVLAMIMGVPVIDLAPAGVSPIWPLADADIFSRGLPKHPTDEQRIIALSRLAHHQFNLDEIASGMAATSILPHTAKRFETLDGLDEAAHVIEQYKFMHENPKRYKGGLSPSFVKKITELVQKYHPDSLLDYGSGKGRQYEEYQQHHQWGGIKPACYDPGYLPYSKKPEGYFDGVICTDVAEHVPPSFINSFLRDVIGYAGKFVFFCIFTDLARKSLPDGRNAHLIVKPPAWWNTQIAEIMATSGAKAYPNITQVDEDTFVLRNQGLEIVVFYRNKDTAKESC